MNTDEASRYRKEHIIENAVPEKAGRLASGSHDSQGAFLRASVFRSPLLFSVSHKAPVRERGVSTSSGCPWAIG